MSDSADGPHDGAGTTSAAEEAAWSHVLSVATGATGAAGPADQAPPTSPEAQAILDLYLPLVEQPRLVIGQLGQSLDGRIATESGASHYVTGPADLDRLHRLRALCDAVVVGAGTVASDDPQLTVRRVSGENPVRVVLDPRARLDPGHRLFTDGAAPTIVVHRAGVEHDASGAWGGEGVEIVEVPTLDDRDRAGGHDGDDNRGHDGADHRGHDGDDDRDRLDLRALLRELRGRGLQRVLVEGGGLTVSSFLHDGLLDRLHVVVAPMLIGSGRPAITLPPIATLDQALRPTCRHVTLGDDVLFDLDLRAESS